MTREEAIINLKLSQNRIGGMKKEEWKALQMAIEALQTEAVQGEWIEVEDDNDSIYWECSNCEDAFVLEVGTPKDNNYNYCPNCGADMGGEEE